MHIKREEQVSSRKLYSVLTAILEDNLLTAQEDLQHLKVCESRRTSGRGPASQQTRVWCKPLESNVTKSHAYIPGAIANLTAYRMSQAQPVQHLAGTNITLRTTRRKLNDLVSAIGQSAPIKFPRSGNGSHQWFDDGVQQDCR